MTANKTERVNEKLHYIAEDMENFQAHPVYGPFLEKHQAILMKDVEAAFKKRDNTMHMKYNSDPKFKAFADKLVGSGMGLGDELMNENGFTFEDNDGSLEKAANQW